MGTALDASGYETDKSAKLLRDYHAYFEVLRDKRIVLLEIGVFKGGSLLLWRDYFTEAIIVGLDKSPCSVDDDTGRIRVYQGSQQDTSILDRIREENAPDGFDVIIDDASHIAEWTKASFWHLFTHHLKPGGLYSIEDWRVGYWGAKWPDGGTYVPPMDDPPVFPSHTHGLVGFIKQLVDELGMATITSPQTSFPISTGRCPRFERMEITENQVFVRKTKTEASSSHLC